MGLVPRNEYCEYGYGISIAPPHANFEIVGLT